MCVEPPLGRRGPLVVLLTSLRPPRLPPSSPRLPRLPRHAAHSDVWLGLWLGPWLGLASLAVAVEQEVPESARVEMGCDA